MVSQAQIEEAEAKQADLLARMQEIDERLGTMTPADPEKRKLVAEKQEILPRYRGAKSHARNLRRTWNSHPESPRQGEPVEAVKQLIKDFDAQDEETVEEVDQEALLGRLYSALTSIASDARDAQPVTVEVEELEAVEDFLNWWEHTHEPG